MTPRTRIASPHRIVAASVAVAACVAGTAAAASWTTSAYPRGASSQVLSLAVAPSGAATVLFPAKKRSIGVLSKAAAGGAWGRSAGTWLPGTRTGGLVRTIAAGRTGGRLSAIWTTSTRGRRTLHAAAGSTARATSTVRATALATPLVGASLLPATPSGLAYGLWSSGDVTGGVMAAGSVPAALPGASSSIPGGAALILSAIDGTGTVTGLVSLGGGQLGAVTRTPGGAWSTPVSIPGTAANGTAGMPVALAVDPAGDAAVAFASTADPATGALAAGGSQPVIAVSQRAGADGAFGTPLVARGPADGSGGQYMGGNAGITVAVSAAVVVVGTTCDPPPALVNRTIMAICATSAAPGQAFPSLSDVPIMGATENWSTQGITSAAAPNGMGAVAAWGQGAQGDTEDLGVTTTTSPGQAWSPEVDLAGANVTEGGYTGVSIQPFANGFVAAWSAALDNDVVYPVPRYPIGVATFR